MRRRRGVGSDEVADNGVSGGRYARDRDAGDALKPMTLDETACRRPIDCGPDRVTRSVIDQDADLVSWLGDRLADVRAQKVAGDGVLPVVWIDDARTIEIGDIECEYLTAIRSRNRVSAPRNCCRVRRARPTGRSCSRSGWCR